MGLRKAEVEAWESCRLRKHERRGCPEKLAAKEEGRGGAEERLAADVGHPEVCIQ